ncbi:MAG: redoxin domain-containing protein [Armatimonas sp.]
MSFGGQSRQRWGDNTIHAGEYIRDIQVTDLSGRVNHTGPMRGKGGLLLVFFDSSTASQELLPVLQQVADACKESGKLSVLGLCAGDEALARAIASETGISFPIALDHGNYLGMTYGIGTYPCAYLVRPNGSVALKLRGLLRPRQKEALGAEAAALCGIAPITLE